MANNSFTDIFTGNPVWAANVSYASYSLTGNISLNWPTQFLDNPNTIGNWTSISVNNNGYIVTLPTAQAASVGQSIVFINSSGSNFSYIIHDNAGNSLVTLTQGKAVSLLLTNNSTAAGSWTVFPFAQGSTTVTSVAATTPSVGLTIGGSPITGAGTLTFTLASQLSTLAGLNSTGIMVQTSTGPSVIASRTIVGGVNIDVANGDGILANPTVNLSDTLAGLSSVVVGSLTLSNNKIQTTAGNTDIQLSPNGTGSILLGAGLTPPNVSSTGNITNVNNLTVTSSINANTLLISSGQYTSNVSNGNVIVQSNGTGTLTLRGGTSSTGNVVVQSTSTNPFTFNATTGITSHPSVALATVTFNGSTAAILRQYNTSSVSRTSAGVYVITWAFNLPANYCVFATSSLTGGLVKNFCSYSFPTATTVTISVVDDAGSPVDPASLSVCAI